MLLAVDGMSRRGEGEAKQDGDPGEDLKPVRTWGGAKGEKHLEESELQWTGKPEANQKSSPPRRGSRRERAGRDGKADGVQRSVSEAGGGTGSGWARPEGTPREELSGGRPLQRQEGDGALEKQGRMQEGWRRRQQESEEAPDCFVRQAHQYWPRGVTSPTSASLLAKEGVINMTCLVLTAE